MDSRSPNADSRAAVIEEALASDAAGVLPAALRSAELHASLPRYQVAMLEYLAEREGTTVNDVLVRELEDVASGRAEELAAAIPGFGAALEWLDGEPPQLPC